MIRALVLSGGGAKGGYTAGCLNYLLGDIQTKYDIICGVSAGAVNGAFLAQYSSGQEKLAALEMSDMWLQLDTPKVYKRWIPFGRLHALWKSSFYNSAPLQQLIREHIKLDKIRMSGKSVNVGTVSLTSGQYIVFNQTSDHFIDAVIASASFPTAFQPISFLGQVWTDGGTQEITPLRTAIEQGATDIDVIMTSPQTRTRKFIENPNTIDVLKRAIDLSSDKIMSNDIDKAQMYNKLAMRGDLDKREVTLNIIRPQFNLIEDLLDFDPAKIRKMMELGYEDAKRTMLA
jgi:NTE family protein